MPMITIGALFCHFVHCQQSTAAAAAANESIDRGQVNKFVINPRRRDDSMQRVIEIGKPNSEKLSQHSLSCLHGLISPLLLLSNRLMYNFVVYRDVEEESGTLRWLILDNRKLIFQLIIISSSSIHHNRTDFREN